MKTMKKLLAAMLAIAMLLTCAAFNPLTATAEGAATDSSETTRYCGNDDYPAKSLGGNYSGMPLNIGKKSDDSTKAASRGGQTILAYARNKYTSDGSYLPYAAWVSFNIDDPAGSFTELSRGGVEFYEAAYDGELIYGLDIDNNFYSVNPETFESTLIGSISDTANSMTYDWEHDTFYIVNSNLQIRELRKDGSLGSAITPANVVCIAPVTYVGNGEFLSLDFNTRNYVRIAADGSTTQLAHSDGLQGWSSSMVYNREDGKCYICYTNMQNGDDTSSVGFWGKLFAIDPVTGEGEYRGFIGEDYGTYVNGMCFIDMGGGEEPQATLDEAMNLVENRHHFVTEGEYPWVPVVFNDELCGASGNQDHVGTTSTRSEEIVETSATAQHTLDGFKETAKIFEQGRKYYDALKAVHDVVKGGVKVKKSIEMVADISEIYVRNYQKMLGDPNYTPDELSTISFGYAKLLSESADILQDLKNVVNVTGMSLSDAERLAIIDQSYKRLLEYRNLVQYYTDKNISVSYLRAKKKKDADRVVALYGDAEDRYW